jgi:hypothetical protein
VRPGRSSEALVARLAATLEPVRPIRPLHRTLLAVAGVWGATAFVVASWLGLHPVAVLARGEISTAFAAALAGIGVAGLTLGFACRVPGRERLAWTAGAGIVLGLALLAIPSGALATALARRGAPWRPRVAGLGLALGATCLGGLLVHLSCPSPSPWHWLLAHVLAPLAAGLPLGLATGGLLDRLSRGSRRAADRLREA